MTAHHMWSLRVTVGPELALAMLDVCVQAEPPTDIQQISLT